MPLTHLLWPTLSRLGPFAAGVGHLDMSTPPWTWPTLLAVAEANLTHLALSMGRCSVAGGLARDD